MLINIIEGLSKFISDLLKAIEVSPQTYMKILRLSAIASGISMWWLSVRFSRQGFQFSIDIPEAVIYSLILSLTVTMIQLVWSKTGGKNLTIIVVGLLAYFYGIYTNIIGLTVVQSVGTAGITATTVTFFGYNTSWFNIILGTMLEITPETFFVWGLTGRADMGDFLGGLVNVIKDFGNILIGTNSGNSKKSTPQQPKQERKHQAQPQRPPSGDVNRQSRKDQPRFR